MISKQQIQRIRSLENKRDREESGCFIAEGDKLVREAILLPDRSRFRVVSVFGLDGWLRDNLPNDLSYTIEVVSISEKELNRISLQKTPNQVLAIIKRVVDYEIDVDFSKALLVGLDRVQDPGNLGTIIRLADWFGLDGILASPDSADFFSPKVVQSSMGSIFRVPLQVVDLQEFIRSAPDSFPVYATDLDGQNIYSANLTSNGLILMGNESRGLSGSLEKLSTCKLCIPCFSSFPNGPESLNVSVAAAVVCSEFRRKHTG